jgi:hypothetical protein
MKWEDLIVPEARTEITMKLCNVQFQVFCPKEDDREQWPKNSGPSLIEIAYIIYKMYSPPAINNKSLEQQLREKPFAYDTTNEMMGSLTSADFKKSSTDSNIGGIGMTDEQNDALAKIIYKKNPTNCQFEIEFKTRTKTYLEKHNTKFDNVQATIFRIRNLLAEFRELGRKYQSFAPATYRFRIKYDDKDPSSNINNPPPNQGKPRTFNDASAYNVTADTPPDTCNICGMTNHSRSNCRNPSRRLTNKSTKSWYDSGLEGTGMV